MAKQKIFLLSPFIAKEYAYTNNENSSLNFIRFYLEDNGYSAEIIDCSKYDEDYNTVIGLLKTTADPIVGVTAYTRERFHAYRLIHRLRNEIPESLIVTGGHHFGFLAEETLLKMPEVDIVVRGEGEITFKEICDYRIMGTVELESIQGISYKKNGSIVHNSDRPVELNIDLFRNYDAKNIVEYTPTSVTKLDPLHKYFTVTASRGCPNQCVFCSLKSDRVRFRSVSSIIEEIKAKIDATSIHYVKFRDPSLTIKESFLKELCERIIDENLNIKFRCYSRVNINVEILHLMRRAGLISVEIGLESASPKVLKSVKKNINLKQFVNFVIEAHNLGIKIYVFCMVSLPDETLDDVNMTIGLIRKIAPYISYAGLQTTRILPDASLYSMAKERGVIPADFCWFSSFSRESTEDVDRRYDSLPVYYEHLTAKQIVQKVKEFNQAMETFSTINIVFLRKAQFREFFRLQNYLRLFRKIFHAFKNKLIRRFDSQINYG
ncbi:MAG: hypothetical protein CMB97_00055 [Flavobacteriaceae bacterium]|nr:hypothetical protein [Flavobacteriaceae bacterium]